MCVSEMLNINRSNSTKPESTVDTWKPGYTLARVVPQGQVVDGNCIKISHAETRAPGFKKAKALRLNCLSAFFP